MALEQDQIPPAKHLAPVPRDGYTGGMKRSAESDLYAPVKRFLEGLGFEAKGEVGKCDVLAVRGSLTVAVELKAEFGLKLVYQGIDRQAVADLVWLCVAEPEGGREAASFRRRIRDAVRLSRMLGLGLMSVRGGRVSVHADPGPYAPRRLPKEKARLLAEFKARRGDHTPGGSTRRPVVTAYREDALRCADIVAARGGPMAVAEIRALAGVERAGAILLRNVYGWFLRTGRGRYDLTPEGHAALKRFAAVLGTAGFTPTGPPPAGTCAEEPVEVAAAAP